MDTRELRRRKRQLEVLVKNRDIAVEEKDSERQTRLEAGILETHDLIEKLEHAGA